MKHILPHQFGVPAERPAPRGTETVLFVEPDKYVRAMASPLLRKCGYHVLEARGAAEALVVSRESNRPIDLVVTDMLPVPEMMTGRGLAERIARTHPHVQVVFTADYVEDVVIQQRLSRGTVRVIEKPFAPEDLARVVREVLDRES